MKIWLVKGDIKGRLCFDAEYETDNFLKIYYFPQRGQVEDWEKLKVTFISTKKRTDILPVKNVTMFWSKSSLFICDEYARQKISERFKKIQFLEVEPIEKEIAQKSSYYLANVLDIVSGLNEEKCSLHYMQDLFLMDIWKYNFNEIVKEYPIFYLKIKGKIYNKAIYATGEFKNYVEECGITGFTFKEVFDFENEDKEYE